jgi:hypothetical protein
MYSIKSPGGSLFPYYFKGGELHCLKYGSFYSNEDALFTLMKAEEAFIINSSRRINMWVDFYETNLTDKVLIMFVENMNRLQNYTSKLSIVGCSFIDKLRLRKKIKKMGIEFSMPIKYFKDPEDAKTWLVSE